MFKRFSVLIGSLCILMPSVVFGYGEDETIPAIARAMHLLINEARSDTVAALSGCGKNCIGGKDSYDAVIAPAYWHKDAYRASQFHANMLSTLGGMCLMHDSPCELVSSAASDYPDKCDGNPSCACKGGTAKCDAKGTETFKRLAMFFTSASAENIAWNGGNAYDVFHAFLYEDGKRTYGHRANILGAKNKAVGIGNKLQWTVQDFGSKASETNQITSGFYYKNSATKAQWFKLHYYADVEAKKAAISINGTCSELSKTGGTTKHGVYGTSELSVSEKCTPFVFEVEDAGGKVFRYPTKGSLLYGCDKTWSDVEIAGCFSAVEPEPEPEPEEPVAPTPGEPEPEPEPEEPVAPTPGEPEPEPEPEEPVAPTPGEPGPENPSEPENPAESEHGDSSCSVHSMGGTRGVLPWLLILPLGLLRRRRSE